jgi:predicted DNA-binding transcriptional regulator AlpA
MSNLEKRIQIETMRAKEVAEYIGIGLSTVWLYAKQGLLKPINLSPRVTVFKKADIDAFVASRIDEVV